MSLNLFSQVEATSNVKIEYEKESYFDFTALEVKTDILSPSEINIKTNKRIRFNINKHIRKNFDDYIREDLIDIH